MHGATIHRPRALRTDNLGSRALFCAVVWLGLLAPTAAQAAANSSVGDQPVCQFGYYGYAPYACAPRGFYGADYFYNGIFVGVGPWADWGYTHGWGDHRFNRGGGRAAVVSPAAVVPTAATPAAAVNPPVVANPVATPKHVTPVEAAPARASAPVVQMAHSSGAIVHSSVATTPVAHSVVGTGPASRAAASLEGTHAVAGRGVVGSHANGVGTHSSVVAGHASGATHASAAHGTGSTSHPSGTYHVPAPTSIGLYHPPPP
jgi:hypothetical protein